MPGAKSQLKHAQPQNRGEAYQQTVKILLSHFPLTEPDARRPQGDEIVRNFSPNLIFSGHEHQSFFLHDGNKQKFEMQKGYVNLNILDHQSEKEMVLPSCNYKMGAAGFGFAVLEQNGSMFYSILWLPPRSKVLLMYLIFIPVILVLINLDKAFRNQSFFSWLMEGAIEAKDEITKKSVFTKRAQRKFRD